MEEKKEKRILQIELDDDLNEFPMQELKTLFNKQSSYTTKTKHLISNNFYEDKKIPICNHNHVLDGAGCKCLERLGIIRRPIPYRKSCRLGNVRHEY